MNKRILFVLLIQVPALVTASSEPLAYQQQRVTLNGMTVDVRLPQGYRLELMTAALDAPRLISFAANGDLFIGSRSGQVYRLPPPYNGPEVLIELDNYPHSVRLSPG